MAAQNFFPLSIVCARKRLPMFGHRVYAPDLGPEPQAKVLSARLKEARRQNSGLAKSEVITIVITWLTKPKFGKSGIRSASSFPT